MKENQYVRRRDMKTEVKLVILAITSLFVLVACGRSDQKPTFTSESQAVFLDNGQVFFGKIENAGADYPLLRDVFYVQNQQDPETKQVKSILIKRGNEWHKPDQMYVNARHIVVIEPVGADSKVAQLIKEAKIQER
jgi:hypothetical protein